MSNSKSILVLFAVIISACSVFAQSAVAEKNDPQATALLEKLSKKYGPSSGKEFAFTMVTEFPGQAKETVQGKLIQQGNAYNLDMGNHKVIADGKTLWLIQDKAKEVQINDQKTGPSKDLSPEKILTLYQSKDYLYALVPNTAGTIKQIEFKPKAKNSDITKFRLEIDPVKNEFSSLKVFNRDGSKYTITIKSVKLNQKYQAQQFTFAAAAFPGYHVEDLRID
ncbi:MAG: outer membrane lipoprotein carrier protein LolA [Saprospiraceae bacterium]